MTLKQTLEMIYAFKGRITNKQGSGMCGELCLWDRVLPLWFIYVFFNCLFIWVSWIIFVLNRKELNVFEACVGTLKQFTRKLQKQTKKTYILCVFVLFIYWVSKLKNVHVLAVTLLFILLTLSFTRDSFPLFVPVSNATSFLYRRCEKQSAEDEG